MMKLLYHIMLAMLLVFVAAPVLADTPKVIPLQKTKNIKAVYQVSDSTQHEGVHKGLFYARKVMSGYAKQGVPASEIDLHLVYHSKAIPALLNDATYQRLTGETGPNPNAAILGELVAMGVHIEICSDTMRQKDVQPTDLLPGVEMVAGAFPRLIDLQAAGYAYIKFE